MCSPIAWQRWKWSRPRIATAGCSSAARIKPAAAPSGLSSCQAWRSVCFRRSCARIRCCWTISGMSLARELTLQDDRAEHERLLLRLAVGAATERLYVSFPRIETAEARARVPSFYALEVMRAVTGRVPDHQTARAEASEEANASLAWPAPQRPEDAIDDFEHDLSVLRLLMRSDTDVKGRAHYMLRLNDYVRRSASERWARARPRMVALRRARPGHGRHAAVSPDAAAGRAAVLGLGAAELRLLSLSISPSALYRLEPLEEPEPLERMDPLTKGSLFHEVQAEFFRALQQRQMPMATTPMDRVLEILDDTLTRVAANYAELLAPAIDRVWQDEIASIRTDLAHLGAGTRREHGMGAVVV